MADRGLTSQIIAELQKRQITVVHLLYFGFTGSPDYFADGRYDIPWNGNTYGATGDWLEIPEVKLSSAPALDNVSIRISGVNQANIYKVLTENFAGVPVTIHRCLLDSAMAIIGDPIEIFSGIMNNPAVTEDPSNGTSEITWSVSSYWADFERIAGRRTNDADQQKWFPGDKGLEFASQTIEELKWGFT